MTSVNGLSKRPLVCLLAGLLTCFVLLKSILFVGSPSMASQRGRSGGQ